MYFQSLSTHALTKSQFREGYFVGGMLQSVFSVVVLRWEDHVLQHRNFQKGKRFASTEEVFRKGKMRYIYCHRNMGQICTF